MAKAGFVRAADDRVSPLTRLVSAIIVPFLIVAFVLLYIFPDHTKALFAWTIAPRMTPMMLGAAYLGGAYFFIRAALNARWHWIALGFLPVTTFATFMGIATIVHWNSFNHQHVSFFAWATLYFTTPFIVPAIWLLNRNADPGTPHANDAVVPRLLRVVIGVVGVVTALISILLFLQPNLMIGTWPWHLTPLTARVMGSMFALTGAGEIAISLYARWSAIRIALQSQMIALALIVLAIVFSWENFNQANLFTWVFVGGLILLLIASPIFYFWMEVRCRKGTLVGKEPSGR